MKTKAKTALIILFFIFWFWVYWCDHPKDRLYQYKTNWFTMEDNWGRIEADSSKLSGPFSIDQCFYLFDGHLSSFRPIS